MARPMIFSAQSVRSVLAGLKTQTRRVIKPQPEDVFDPAACPWLPGDLVWVKETWAVMRMARVCGDWEAQGIAMLDSYAKRPANDFNESYHSIYQADGYEPCEGEAWRSPYFMPKWASRLTVKILTIEPQRLQDITEDDAVAEGYSAHHLARHAIYAKYAAKARDNFSYGWDSINKRRGWGWDTNPYVWAITFEKYPFTWANALEKSR